MMPDRYEELRKRQALAQLQPMMGEQTQMDSVDPEQTFKMNSESPIDIDVPYTPSTPSPIIPEEPARQPSGGMDGTSAMYLGDAAASVGPGLLAFLGGASPSVSTGLFDKGNQYAMNRGKQEEITKDKLSVIDDNGLPKNVLTRDAVGLQPYYQPKGAAGLAGRSFQPITLKHIKTGEIVGALQDSNGYFDQKTKEPFDMREWLPFKAPIILRERTVQGGQIAKGVNPYNTTEVNSISAQQGLGDRFGRISKEEANSAIGSAEKAKDKSVKSVEAYENAKSSFETLSQPNLTPEMAAAGIYKIVKATNGERVSDSDYANLRGEEFKSYARQIEDWSEGRLNGRPSPQAIEAFKVIAQDIMLDKKREAESIKQNYVPSNLIPSKEGQKRLDTMSSKAPEPSNKNWRQGLKGI